MSMMNEKAPTRNRRRFPPWLTLAIGGLAGLLLPLAMRLLGNDVTYFQAALSVVLGIVGGAVVWFMDLADDSECRGVAPNPRLTVILLVASTFLFWIPVIGLALISYAIYRSRWLEVSDWVLFPFTCFFFLSVGITLVWGIILVLSV